MKSKPGKTSSRFLKLTRRIGMALAVLTLTGAAVAQDKPNESAARITELELTSRVFSNTRTIRVLVPPGYHQKDNIKKHYPVFYFTDGRAAFDEPGWNLAGIAEELWRLGAIEEFIFVGIDNGGSSKESENPVLDRAGEYLPYDDPTWLDKPVPKAKGKEFPSFLFDEVMPLVEKSFRVKKGPENTGLAGASYGGAVTLYTALNYADRIGYVLIESPSLQVGDGRLLLDAADASKLPDAIYLGVGTKEGETKEIQENTQNSVLRLHKTFASSGLSNRLKLEVQKDGTHWYDAWRNRLPGALRFLIGTASSKLRDKKPSHAVKVNR